LRRALTRLGSGIEPDKPITLPPLAEWSAELSGSVRT
jgi:hypothetical protein